MKTAARILVVEDQGIVAMDIERQLTRLGYECVGTTSTAEDAVKLAADLRPDLVLMDIHLAGVMDGIEAATRIRADLSIPSVFLTAYATDEVVERAKGADPLGYIVKPFDEYNLRTSIEIALHKDRIDSKLRESEARYRAVAKSASLQAAALRAAANAIVITDRSGVIEWVNPAFSALTGFSAVEAVGRNPRSLVRSGTHDDAFYAAMWDTIISGQVWDGELTNRRKDGTLYREQQTITPVLDADGSITHFVAIKRDLTREKSLQEQVLQAQKMEVVGRLAGGIAHDFNNLLTVINGESDLALDGLPADDPMRRPLENILQAGNGAARLTKQLLVFSRRQLASPCIVSASAQVKGLGAMLRRLIGEDIKLSLDVPETGASDHVLIDKSQLEQVVLNLAVNARDAMPNGGALNIQVRAANARVLIAVSDTGTGITPEVQARLFEPFFTTKPQGKGTGLGLATVHAIVTDSGGTLEVESEVGHGATFTVLLPQSACVVEPDSELDAISTGNEIIVLVEDEHDIREITARMLRSLGYQVLAMETSAAALSWLRDAKRPVDLLVTDVVMPGLSGPELAAAVALFRPDLRVLFTSGYTDDKLTPEVIAQPERFIAKPYPRAALAEKVRRILDAELVA